MERYKQVLRKSLFYFFVLVVFSLALSQLKICVVASGDFQDDKIIDLHLVLEDAKSICDSFEKTWTLSQDDIIYVENPTLARLSSSLTQLFTKAQKSDKLIFLFFGHAFVDNNNIYLLVNDSSSSSLRSKSYNLTNDLDRLLKITPAEEIMIFLNTGYSEKILETANVPNTKMDAKTTQAIQNVMRDKKVMVILNAETLNTHRTKDNVNELTRLLKSALFEPSDEIITVKGIYEYIKKGMEKQTKIYPMLISNGNYDIELFKGKEELKVESSEGRVKWKFETGGGIYTTPAIGKDGTIYVGSDDGYLYAISSDEKLRWKFQTKDRIFSSPAIGQDGTIYFGSNDSNLYALSTDGRLKWSFKTEGSVYSTPAIGADGTIYFGSGDSFVYALGSDGKLK